MIFYISSLTVFLSMLWLMNKNWYRLWAKIVFIFICFSISTLLVFFAKKITFKINIKETARRVIVLAVDVSSSMNLDTDVLKKTVRSIWKDYNIELIPFSNKLFGKENADNTALVSSLNELEKYINIKYDDDNIAGLVLITDGNETDNISLMKDSKVFDSASYYKNVIYQNSKAGEVSIDKSVVFSKVPRFIPRYKKERVYFSVGVYGVEIDHVPVELILNGKNLGNVYVDLKNGYGEGSFELIIKEAGLSLLEAVVAVDSRETISSNNKDSVVVESVIDDYRVLHLSGHPSVDTSFVRGGLQNIPGLDMISFFILRKPGQVSSELESELSLIPFPIDQLFRKELENFDIIVVNDFKLSEFLASSYINNIASFVENGGGLLVFGGSNSFIDSDYYMSNFGNIIPITPSNNNWTEQSFAVKSKDTAMLTPLRNIKFPNEKIFSGLNNVKIKDWGTVLFETSDGKPLIVSGIINKGRVLVVLTDSLWRLSYNAGISNESVLKYMMRYLLGVSVLPVTQIEENLSFNNELSKKIKKDSNISATLNYKGQEKAIITIDKKHDLSTNEAAMYDINIKQGDNLIERYRFVNIAEKNMNENAFNPMGRKFLNDLATKSNANFIETTQSDLFFNIVKSKLKEAVSVVKGKEVDRPLYEDRMIIILFMYLVIFAFYLKSRYCD